VSVSTPANTEETIFNPYSKCEENNDCIHAISDTGTACVADLLSAQDGPFKEFANKWFYGTPQKEGYQLFEQ